MASSRNRVLPAIASFFIVGAGQVIDGRYWAGICLFIIFYAPILVLKAIWKGVNPGFWAILAAWIIVWLYNIFDAWKGPNNAIPPCERTCPAGIAPWIYINQIATQAPWKYPFIPFFKILALICPAPCENHCTRRGVDKSVAIRELKNRVETDKTAPATIKRKAKIAVIGAGPCGLTLAYTLANKGYDLTVYERENKPGGVLAAFIPDFRLPSSILHAEIKSLMEPGFDIKYGIELGKNVAVDDLLKDHDYLFLATGAWIPVKLGIPGEENGLVGLDILRRIKNSEKFDLGRVGVVGGGNTAFDVARCLRRLGNEVKIYYRRRVEDMPAEHENRIEAEEEGIEIVPLTTPVGIVKNSVLMAKTHCVGGRQSTVEVIKGSEFDVKINNIVMAIGQKPDTEFLTKHLKIDNMDRVVVKNGRTSHPRIFAGGDLVWGAKTLAHAVGDGMRAAERMDGKIRKVPPIFKWLAREKFLPRTLKQLKFSNEARIQINHREAAKRIKDFKMTEQPIPVEQLVTEANRCLTCPLKYRP